MKYLIILTFTACAIIMTGCYPKVDPALIYTQQEEVKPDTLTERGRTINEIISSRTVDKLDSTFTDYSVGKDLMHPKHYPDYYGGLYLDCCGKLVIVVIGDTVAAKKDIVRRCGKTNFRLQQGQYSYAKLEKTMDTINAKRFEHFEPMTTAGINTTINRVIVGLLECSPKNIYHFRKRIIDSPAVVYEKSGYVIPL